MTVQEHAAWLSKNGYLVKHQGGYIFTHKFNQAMYNRDEGIVSCKTPKMKEVLVDVVQVNWIKIFQDLIISAEVPKYSSDSKGQSYQINGATKPGREAFRDALLETDITNLRARMKDYYSQNNGKYRVKVETYFEKEMWRNAGTVDKVTRSDDGTTITKPNL